MESPYGFRFTLGQLMGVIAVTAVFLAATIFSINGQNIYLALLYHIIALSAIGVFLYNIRLSRWMWIVIVGYAGPIFWGIIMSVMYAVWPALIPDAFMMTASFTPKSVFSLLFVVGLAMTFQDVRRTLTSRENAP
jgi:hypothetical protein